MEARILELLQHPDKITAEDIALLQKEVTKYPYMQSLRTLQLSAVYHFDAEHYPQELTKTAAYTTDKKILYQFINKKNIEEKKEAAKLKKIVLAQEKPVAQTPEVSEAPVNETKTEEVVTIKEEPKESTPFPTRPEDLNFTKETVLDQFDQRSQEEEPIVAPAEISFNAFDSFLPEVKFTAPSQNLTKEEPSIVEEKAIPEEPKPIINFYQPKAEEVKEPEASKVEETTPEPIQETVLETPKEELSFSWKPLNWSPQPLDAQIKQEETKEKPSTAPEMKPEAVIVEAPKEKEPQVVETPKEEIVETVQEDPINTVSEPEVETPSPEEVKEETSNIPNFVETWQTWLKIDRSQVEEVKAPETILEKKTEIIDRFIEENPKISQLKEDTQYVVKEKNDDIWHLMTETLAKLYVEQRLYSKAIKAYEVLQEKHPSRREEFEERILEIKDLKQNK